MSRDRSPISFGDRLVIDNSSNLDLFEEIKEIIEPEMANISQIEMNMAKDMLPEYSGGSKNLAYFIKQVDTYINLLRKPDENCLFNRLLFEQVKSKLVGSARDVLITTNCNKWSDVKDALLRRFGDPRSEELLLHDLTTCFQKHNEAYEDYLENIKRKLQVLIEHVNIHTQNHEVRVNKEIMYAMQALSTFKAGVLEPYCTHLISLNVNTLEEALFACRKYDNERAQVGFMTFMRNKSKPPTSFKKPFSNAQNRNPAQNSFSSRPSTNFFPIYNKPTHQVQNAQQNVSSNNFPRGPINIQTRPVQQKFPTNSQVFKKPDYKPTPMSISTRNTFSRPQQNNYFRPQSMPTFVSEELFNVEQNFDPNSPQSYYTEHDSENYEETPEQNFQNESAQYSENYNENFPEHASE